VTEIEGDLSSKLDWTAVDPWKYAASSRPSDSERNTDEGRDQAMTRYYIGKGISARAEHSNRKAYEP
jgi:hypothetical protein